MTNILKFTGTKREQPAIMAIDWAAPVIDMHGFAMTGQELTPEAYGKVVARAMDNKEQWVNAVVALAVQRAEK